MQSANRIIMASAGSGKTTTIVNDAAAATTDRSALITYTNNSSAELRDKTLELHGHIPSHMEVGTWYSFLLRHFVRPYQLHLHRTHVSKLLFVQGRSARFVREADTDRFYFGPPGEILSDKVSQFACKLIDETGGKPLARFEQVFDRLYIDESQDLAGYDLELIERILDSHVDIILVGDHRQATYSTNHARKNAAYKGHKIVDKYEEWRASGRADFEYQNHSRRCVQDICNFADALFPDFPKTVSLNHHVTGHDGVFVVRKGEVPAYLEHFDAQTLRYNRRTKDVPGIPYNFGEAKGMTFNRTLIYPHGKLLDYLKSGDLADAGAELAKIYVAVTRARQSVAFVVPDEDATYMVSAFEA